MILLDPQIEQDTDGNKTLDDNDTSALIEVDMGRRQTCRKRVGAVNFSNPFRPPLFPSLHYFICVYVSHAGS